MTRAPRFSAAATFLLALLGAEPRALSADPRPQPLLDTQATVHLFLAEDPEATTSRAWVLAPHEEPRVSHMFTHAPGAMPRGFLDGAGGMWAVVADGPSRAGAPARLVHVDARGNPRTMLEGLPVPQAAVPAPDGGALVFTGSETSGWTLWHAPLLGAARAVLHAPGAWMVPVRSSRGFCALTQDAWTAVLACAATPGAPAVRVRTWKDALFRDVTLLDGVLTAVEARRDGAVLVTGAPEALTVVARQADARLAPVVAGPFIVFSDGVGGGAVVLRNGVKQPALLAAAGTRVVPLGGSAHHVVLRVDEQDGRRAPVFHVLNLLNGSTTPLRTGASVVELVGVTP